MGVAAVGATPVGAFADSGACVADLLQIRATIRRCASATTLLGATGREFSWAWRARSMRAKWSSTPERVDGRPESSCGSATSWAVGPTARAARRGTVRVVAGGRCRVGWQS